MQYHLNWQAYDTFTGKGGAVKFNELLKIQIKVHYQILNKWREYPILNLKKN